MTWIPISPQWPEKTCRWASDIVLKTQDREATLAFGRTTLMQQFDQRLSCMALTPYQPSVGQGQGQQRFLSANNLLDQLGSQLLNLPPVQNDNHALVILCLAATPSELAKVLGRLNTLLPVPELQRCERRARALSTLETEKWHKPVAASLPQWDGLAMQTLPIPRNARQVLEARLNAATTAAPRPVSEALKQLAERKLVHQNGRAPRLPNIEAMQTEDLNLRVRRIGPGDPRELRRQLLDGAAPGHEWIMCAGVMMVGDTQALSFVSELVGL